MSIKFIIDKNNKRKSLDTILELDYTANVDKIFDKNNTPQNSLGKLIIHCIINYINFSSIKDFTYSTF